MCCFGNLSPTLLLPPVLLPSPPPLNAHTFSSLSPVFPTLCPQRAAHKVCSYHPHMEGERKGGTRLLTETVSVTCCTPHTWREQGTSSQERCEEMRLTGLDWRSDSRIRVLLALAHGLTVLQSLCSVLCSRLQSLVRLATRHSPVTCQ